MTTSTPPGGRIPETGGYFRILFDTTPIPVMIMDGDARIRDFNPAAEGMVGPDRQRTVGSPCGNAFHCVNAGLHPDGCGHAEQCRECVVRNTVEECIRDRKPLRGKTRMSVADCDGNAASEMELLVTAVPFTYGGDPLVLLMLQDVTELMRLRSILPICSHCGKVRADRGYWESVEDYLRKHPNLLLSHAVCDACLEMHYKGIMRRNGND